jgi:hypothetical protein
VDLERGGVRQCLYYISQINYSALYPFYACGLSRILRGLVGAIVTINVHEFPFEKYATIQQRSLS